MKIKKQKANKKVNSKDENLKQKLLHINKK